MLRLMPAAEETQMLKSPVENADLSASEAGRLARALKIRLVATLAIGVAGCSGADPMPLVPPAPVAPAASQATAARAHSAQVFASADPRYSFTDPDRRRKLASAFPAIDALIDAEMQQRRIPGIAVGIVIDGELAYAKGSGFADVEKKIEADADTIFRIGSISKSFTALALLSLRDEGVLALDDSLARWLPEASGLVYPTHDAAPITLRQMLTHTSGLPRQGFFDPEREPSEELITASLSGMALENAPGVVWQYSNVGFVLLGLAVGRAAHAPLREVAAKRILTPLGMTSTAWDRERLPAGRIATGYDPGPSGMPIPVPERRVGAAAGSEGIYSSVRDMARYIAMELDAYPPRSAPESGPVRRSTLRETHSTGFHKGLLVRLAEAPKKDESLIQASSSAYGFGWEAYQSCNFDHIVSHAGRMPGFTADVEMLPDHGVGIVALANTGRDDEPATIVARAVGKALKESGGLSKRSPALSPAFESAMKKLLAVYNRWDEAGYAAMLSAGREKMPEEKDELASYKALHGACNGFAPIDVLSPLSAHVKLDCEHGPFEMKILGTNDGLIVGFIGITPDAPIPPALKKVADRVTRLIGAWDEGTYAKHLAKTKKTKDETAAAFEALRGAHGACTVKSSRIEGFERAFVLDCQRGGRLSLKLMVEPKHTDTVVRYGFKSGGEGTCPVR